MQCSARHVCAHALPLQGWVGLPYGSKVTAKAPSTGWVYLLRPTPELWTRVLTHRTQILYAGDISLTCFMLELQPGRTGVLVLAGSGVQGIMHVPWWLSLAMLAVLECGTGSGSLTHALARAVAPSGHVHTFEYHAPRAEAARQELLNNGLSAVVTLQERDIQEEGFPAELHGRADAVFLDVPGPWKVGLALLPALFSMVLVLQMAPTLVLQAAESAAACLKPNGCLASFSPCMEQVRLRLLLALAATSVSHTKHLCPAQVQKMRGACAACGFWDVRVMECLLREYEVRSRPVSTLTSPAQPGRIVHLLGVYGDSSGALTAGCVLQAPTSASAATSQEASSSRRRC